MVDSGNDVPFFTFGKVRNPVGFERQNMRYNWDRAPTGFQRHRKALAAVLLIAGGVGLMLAALPL
ncbi:hypothetical protein GCM10010869_19400 [Mesorhizobium tianshanense]|nr:hypothetical protein GCM10010869_19400 [Mesorhizobium tianshanense]